MKRIILSLCLMLTGCDSEIVLPKEAHNTVGNIPIVEGNTASCKDNPFHKDQRCHNKCFIRECGKYSWGSIMTDEDSEEYCALTCGIRECWDICVEARGEDKRRFSSMQINQYCLNLCGSVDISREEDECDPSKKYNGFECVRNYKCENVCTDKRIREYRRDYTEEKGTYPYCNDEMCGLKPFLEDHRCGCPEKYVLSRIYSEENK